MKLPSIGPCTVNLHRHELLRSAVEDEEFLKYAQSCAAMPQSAVLLGGGMPVGSESRYSLAAWDPFLVLTTKDSCCTVWTAQQTQVLDGNAIELLNAIDCSFQPEFSLLEPPFSGGAIGYFAYDLKNQIERLPQNARDDVNLPDIFLIWPRRILIHDRFERNLRYLEMRFEREEIKIPPIPPLEEGGQATALDERRMTGVLDKGALGRASDRGVNSDNKVGYKDLVLRMGDLQSNFSHDDYLEAIRKVRHYIREGDVYQVNLSQRFQFPFAGDPFQLWRSLYDLNPAPFYAFINAGDHQVLSTSMERFLYQRGRDIETRPIKGTRKRGQTPEEDEELKLDLIGSAKDDAELSMIVDLLRNDLGRVCSPRTVRVLEHKQLETYQNVHHLVSIVAGQLRPGTTRGDVLRATFPGGSITGCPKIRAMQIIDELEPNARHVYTGSIGYLGWHDNLDLNVAIRTAVVKNGTCYFSVGGGIIYDSQEEDEYQETLHKGRTLFEVIERIGKSDT